MFETGRPKGVIGGVCQGPQGPQLPLDVTLSVSVRRLITRVDLSGCGRVCLHEEGRLKEEGPRQRPLTTPRVLRTAVGVPPSVVE